MPKGYPKSGKKASTQHRVYRPDLTDHFILVHPAKQLGIVQFNVDKTKASVIEYRFDADGDMHLGNSSWKAITDKAKGKCIVRKDHYHYLHDFIRPPANPYS
jgi:hypothetical protein